MSLLLRVLHVHVMLCVKLMAANAKLIAYNCDANSSEKVTSFDVFDVHTCEDAIDRTESKEEFVQILSFDTYDMIEVLQCRVHTSILKTGCGEHSHMYAVRDGYEIQKQKVGAKKCKDMHKKKSMKVDQKSRKLVVNETNYFSYVLGGVDDKGNCQAKNGNLIHQVIMEVRLRQIWVKVNTLKNKMYFPDGVTLTYTDKYYYDPLYGDSYWNTITNVFCRKDRYAVLYRGIANVYHSPNYNQTILYSPPNGAEFVLPMVDRTSMICDNFKVYQSVYHNLVVVRNDKRTTPYNSGDMSSRVMEFTAARPLLDVDLLNGKLASQRCQMKAIKQQVAYLLAVLDPDEFAYFKMQTFGYTSLKYGDIIHIMKCQQEAVEIRTTDKCYNHIPIIRSNEENAFMTIRTHIIRDTAEQVDCLTEHL